MKPLKILVTAGPTREPIDPVRFISNPSTGYMGYSIASVAKKRGHSVTLISGPTHLSPPKGVKLLSAVAAKDMLEAVRANCERADCVIMAAAVSDYAPLAYAKQKIKRRSGVLSVRLRPNPDILKWLGGRKGEKILVGFCMETENLLANARKKKLAKNLDIIVANAIDRNLSAFGSGRTSAIIIGADNKQQALGCVSKERIASILLDKIEQLWYKKLKS